MTADLTTDRAVHVAAYRQTFFAEVFRATWYDHSDGYAYTNTAPLGVVVHFRAPLHGGKVEVNSVAGDAWTDARMDVRDWQYTGWTDAGEYAGATYVPQTMLYDGAIGGPLALY